MTPLIVLVGPTASGKSRLAVDLAHKLGERAEIVNGDAMLIYRGMNIGSAKPSLNERGGVAHHLIDVLDITETASVADFQRMARESIAEIRARGSIAILVGGSNLYVRAVVDDFDFPGTDPKVRQRWDSELERIGPQALHQILAAKAPAAAQEINSGNGRRIVRALEIFELTGRVSGKLPQRRYVLDEVYQFGLRLARPALDQRIAERVAQMWDDGLVSEVRELAEHGLREGLTASRGLGYRQVLAFLDGKITEDEAKQQTIDATRRFSRKQLGWFRRDPRIYWLYAGDPENPAKIMTALGLRP